MPTPTLSLISSGSSAPSPGNVVNLDQARLQRADQRACQYAAQEGGRIDHFSHLQRAFEAGRVYGPREQNNPVCLFSAEEGHVGGYLSQFTASGLQTAAAYMTAYAAATAWAGAFYQCSADLLHRASVLTATLARSNLAGRSRTCRTGRGLETCGRKGSET